MEHTKAAEEQRVTQVLLRSHVERCLQDIWDTPDLVIDDDGDYPYRRGTAMCWVSPFDGPVPGVRVFAHAAYGLKPVGEAAAGGQRPERAQRVGAGGAAERGGAGVGRAALGGGRPVGPGAGGPRGRLRWPTTSVRCWRPCTGGTPRSRSR